MRSLAFVPVLLALAACGEAPRRTFKIPMEGQSPPASLEPPKPVIKEPPPPNSAMLDSPVWLRQNSPIAWTTPSGWEEIQSTRPQRIVEFTVEKDGPGKAPIQMVLLNGADDHPAARQASITRWETFFHEDTAPQTTTFEQNGVRVTKMRIHGDFEGQPVLGSSEMVKEPNWTLICGWAEGPAGSIMFKLQGPDAIVKAHEAKVDELLKSFKPAQKKDQ
jgi:hypothetical protein